MCEFHGSNGNGLGDIWWTDKFFYFSIIDYVAYAFVKCACVRASVRAFVRSCVRACVRACVCVNQQ